MIDFHGFITLSLGYFPGRCTKYCDEYACPSVRSHNSKITRPNFTKLLCMLPMAGGSVLLWQRCDMLGTSGFVDDVMFSHKDSVVHYAVFLSGNRIRQS